MIVLEQLHLKLYPATMLFKERGINTIVCFVIQRDVSKRHLRHFMAQANCFQKGG